MARVLLGNLPPGTTIRNIDDFCSPYGRLLYVDVKNQGNSTMACVEYESQRNAQSLVRARHGFNFNGYNVQLKVMEDTGFNEVRNDSRPQESSSSSSGPAWYNNSQANALRFGGNMQALRNNYNGNGNSNGNSSNNGISFGNNGFGGNINNFDSTDFGGNGFGNNDCGPSGMDSNNSLDYNEACRIVFERFLREGYNRQVAKEKTLEFVRNMQGGTNQGFNSFNSNYCGPDQQFQSNSGNNNGNSNANFNGNANGNFNANGQNWGRVPNNNNNNNNRNSGNGFFAGGNQRQFPNVKPNNWVGNGPRNQNGPPQGGWVAGHGRNQANNAGGMNMNSGRPAIGGYRPNMGPSTPGRNFGPPGQMGNRYNNANTFSPQGPNNNVNNIATPEGYAKSLLIRNKIEQKIKNGTSTPRDLKSLLMHQNIIATYEKFQRKGNFVPKNQQAQVRPQIPLQQYKSALGIVMKYAKVNKATLPDEIRNNYFSNKAIVNAYRQSMSSQAKEAELKFVRKKNAMLRKAKKDYPFKFVLSGAAKRKKNMLMQVGINAEESAYLALNSDESVNDLVELKKAAGKYHLVVNKKSATDAKPAEEKTATADILAKKLKAGCRSARKVLAKHENSDISKLTDKEKAIIRISLRRLRSFNQSEGIPVEATKFDFLLDEVKSGGDGDEEREKGAANAKAAEPTEAGTVNTVETPKQEGKTEETTAAAAE